MPETITPLDCQFAVPVGQGGILFDLNRYIPDASGTLVPQDPPPYSREEVENISHRLSDGMALPELKLFYQKMVQEAEKKSGNPCLTIPVKVDKILCSQKNKACFLNEGTLVCDGLTLDSGMLARTLSDFLPSSETDKTSVLTYQLPQGQVVFDLTPYQKNEQGDLVPAPLTAYDVWQRDQVKKNLDQYFATMEGQNLYQQIFKTLNPQNTHKIRVPLKIDFSKKKQGVLGSYSDGAIILASPTLDLETFHHESIHFLQDALYPGLFNLQNYPYEASFSETGLMIETEAALEGLWFATNHGDKTSDQLADCQVMQELKEQFSKTISDPVLLKQTVLRTYFREHLLTGPWGELYSKKYQKGAFISEVIKPEIIKYREKGDKCPDEILNAQAHIRQNLKKLGLEERDLKTLAKMADDVRNAVMERKLAHEEERKAMDYYFPATLGKIKELNLPKVPKGPLYVYPQEPREK